MRGSRSKCPGTGVPFIKRSLRSLASTPRARVLKIAMPTPARYRLQANGYTGGLGRPDKRAVCSLNRRVCWTIVPAPHKEFEGGGRKTVGIAKRHKTAESEQGLNPLPTQLQNTVCTGASCHVGIEGKQVCMPQNSGAQNDRADECLVVAAVHPRVVVSRRLRRQVDRGVQRAGRIEYRQLHTRRAAAQCQPAMCAHVHRDGRRPACCFVRVSQYLALCVLHVNVAFVAD